MLLSAAQAPSATVCISCHPTASCCPDYLKQSCNQERNIWFTSNTNIG